MGKLKYSSHNLVFYCLTLHITADLQSALCLDYQNGNYLNMRAKKHSRIKMLGNDVAWLTVSYVQVNDKHINIR